jgi:hypothetical protein
MAAILVRGAEMRKMLVPYQPEQNVNEIPISANKLGDVVYSGVYL